MTLKKITAKFNGVCAATGKKIRKGDEMFYDYDARKCYTIGNEPKQDNDRDPAAGMIEANENAYWDDFCRNNNI